MPASRTIQPGIDAAASDGYTRVMRTFTAIVERDPETHLFIGYVPGFAGAHSQGASLDELNQNLREVISMLIEDGEPQKEFLRSL